MTMVNSAAEAASATATANTNSTKNSIPRLTEDALKSLSHHAWVAVPDFLSTATTTALRFDLMQLRQQGCFSVSKIGHDGILIQDEQTPFRDIRHSETCALNMMMNSPTSNPEKVKQGDNGGSVPAPPAPLVLMENSKAHMELYEILNGLRHDLQNGHVADNDIALDETLEEVMYAYYPVGGYYKRHLDAEQHSASCWRQYSFLLYLNDATEWNNPSVNNNGGQLRLHRDSGADFLPTGELPNFIDIPPQGGTLVIFKSHVVPHEVLPTCKEGRMAVVGWFLAKDIIINHANDNHDNINTRSAKDDYSTTTKTPCRSIHPEALTALRALRQAVPGLERKLEPASIATQPDHQSGLLENDWGIVMDVTTNTTTTTPSTTTTATTTTAPTFHDDTDPRYWKSIAAFDEHGHISTLSLGGQRLRKLPNMSVLLAPALWKKVVTVDLANTDLPVPILCQVLEQIAVTQQQQQQTSSASLLSSRLTQLYLGGNALGGGCGTNNNSSSSSGLAEIMPHLTAAAIATLQVLDLRFNDLGPPDAALLAKFLQEDSCRCEKLYLEGNALGDEGAQHLANVGGENNNNNNKNSNNNSLRELYLGANGIGPDGAAALAKGLVGIPGSRLEKLYLEGNCIGPEGARSFIEVLENAKNAGNGENTKGKSTTRTQHVALQKLYVDNNNIGKKEAVRLGHALGQVTVIGETNLYQEEE